MENQQLVMKQVRVNSTTELYYIERIDFRKDVNTSSWAFELKVSGESSPIFVVVGFQARNKIASQLYINAVFDRLPASNVVRKIASKNTLLMG